jgi:hypothetical protein
MGVNIKITSSRNGIPNEVSFSRPALRGAGDSGQGPMTDLGHSASGLFVLGIAERVLDGGWLSEPFPRFWRQTVRRHNCFQKDPLGVFHVVLPTLPTHIRRPLPHRHLDPVESRPIGKQVGVFLFGRRFNNQRTPGVLGARLDLRPVRLGLRLVRLGLSPVWHGFGPVLWAWVRSVWALVRSDWVGVRSVCA